MKINTENRRYYASPECQVIVCYALATRNELKQVGRFTYLGWY